MRNISLIVYKSIDDLKIDPARWHIMCPDIHSYNIEKVKNDPGQLLSPRQNLYSSTGQVGTDDVKLPPLLMIHDGRRAAAARTMSAAVSRR